MKRKNIGLCALITVTLMAACNSAPQGSCRIHGVVDDDRLNGKQIFLVPLEDDSAEAVDSVYIKDGKLALVNSEGGSIYRKTTSYDYDNKNQLCISSHVKGINTTEVGYTSNILFGKDGWPIGYKTSQDSDGQSLFGELAFSFYPNNSGIQKISILRSDSQGIIKDREAVIEGYLVDHDVCDYLINECSLMEIDSNYSTGLITLAEMNNLSIVNESFKNLDVTAISTAGVRTNASRAGDPASYWEENGEFHFGTINIIVLVNVKLSESTLMEAFMTATEAKTVALNNLKIPSQYSNGYATGTGTDGLCIFSDIDSGDVVTNAGKHSKLGELIGKCVIESVTKAVGKQVWITNKSQSNVLVRLNRYSLDINEFYDELDCDKDCFIRQLQIDMNEHYQHHLQK